MKTVDDLQQKISGYLDNPNTLPRSKHAVVQLGEKTQYIDICVLSNIMVGLTGPAKPSSKFEKPFRIKKLIAHIAELKNNPHAKVFLGGDLFYFPGGSASYRELYSPSYDDQVDLLYELLMPIRDKIICAYDGTDETKIFEKDGINLTKKLMQKLGLADRYFGQMAEVDFVFKNEQTGFVPKVVNMLFDHGFLVANVMPTVAKKTKGLQDKINGKDFYFTSHYNKMFIEKTAVLQADSTAHMIKKPCYFVSVTGYRDYPNRLTSNRNVGPTNTNNGMIRVFVVPNPDRNNIRGNNYLGEPAFKVCQEFINFGRSEELSFDYRLIDEIAKLNERNIIYRDALLQRVQEKIDKINKENANILIEKYYGKKDAENASGVLEGTLKQGKKQTTLAETVYIKEKEDDGRQ